MPKRATDDDKIDPVRARLAGLAAAPTSTTAAPEKPPQKAIQSTATSSKRKPAKAERPRRQKRLAGDGAKATINRKFMITD